MRIKICLTHEILDPEWEGIVKGFSESFDRPTTVDKKIFFYSNNLFGFSYHAIAFNKEGQVIGHTTIIPSFYKINDDIKILGLSSGTFVCKEYRKNIFLIRDMHNGLLQICRKDNIALIVGVPNRNILQYNLNILNATYISNLNYYVLPLRFSNLINMKMPAFLNHISFAFFRGYIFMCLGLSYIINRKEKEAPIALKLSDDYLRCRFKKGYNSYVRNDISCHYKIEEERGIKIAYLMEFNNCGIPDLKSLAHSLWFILESHNVDAIAYIGTLRLWPRFFLKAPRGLEPQALPLTCEILDKAHSNKDMALYYNIKNWKFSLINFDVK